MRTKAFHSIVKTCRSTSHVRRHDGLLYNCDVRSCKGGSLASRPERLVPNRLKPGNSRMRPSSAGTERHALKRCGACMRPSSAHKFAGTGLQDLGITHLRCSDSLRSLLSHFPLQLKLGKIRRSPGERCMGSHKVRTDGSCCGDQTIAVCKKEYLSTCQDTGSIYRQSRKTGCFLK